MRSMILALVLAWSVLVVAPEGARAAESPVIDTKVVGIAKDQPMVSLSAGEQTGISPGDEFWLLGEAGIVGSGEIVLTTAETSAGRVLRGLEKVSADQSVVVLRREAISDLRDQMPPGATLRGKILRLPPGRRTAWIDINASSGLKVNDQVLVSRKGIPISRGRIKILEDNAALTSLEPLVSNALPEAGDRVELWPAPSDARWGRLNTTVLRVIEGSEGTLDRFAIVVAGTAQDGLASERLMDVYRGRQYVGVAKVVEVSNPNSAAKMVDVATGTRPAEGDQAVVRASPDGPPGPLIAPVFKVDQDYCLIAAGELDGIKQGEKFLVRRQDEADPMVWHDVATLSVEHVEPVYSGALIRALTSEVAGVRVWDMAERQVPGVAQWRTAGVVEKVDLATRTGTASVERNCPVKVGAVVAWVPEREASPGAGIVFAKEDDRLIVYVPPGWGDIEFLLRARIDYSK